MSNDALLKMAAQTEKTVTDLQAVLLVGQDPTIRVCMFVTSEGTPEVFLGMVHPRFSWLRCCRVLVVRPGYLVLGFAPPYQVQESDLLPDDPKELVECAKVTV